MIYKGKLVSNVKMAQIKEFAQSILTQAEELEQVEVHASWNMEAIDTYLTGVLDEIRSADDSLGGAIYSLEEEMLQ